MSKMTALCAVLGVASISIAGGVVTAAISNVATPQTHIHMVRKFTMTTGCNNHVHWYINQISTRTNLRDSAFGFLETLFNYLCASS